MLLVVGNLRSFFSLLVESLKLDGLVLYRTLGIVKVHVGKIKLTMRLSTMDAY